ncbi:MAG: DUF1871 family protein [Oscillospiraceae bacterium]|nr:DUF1871 family protein [Oscillospiraceae bacterium]
MDDPIKYDIVKRAVDAADPCGLLEIGAPSDEYELEIGRIAKAVSKSDTEESIAGVAAEVFSKAFNCKIAVERFREFACNVWNELHKNGLI